MRQLLSQVVPAQRYLFMHRSDLSKRISENTLNGALRRMGYPRARVRSSRLAMK